MSKKPDDKKKFEFADEQGAREKSAIIEGFEVSDNVIGSKPRITEVERKAETVELDPEIKVKQFELRKKLKGKLCQLKEKSRKYELPFYIALIAVFVACGIFILICASQLELTDALKNWRTWGIVFACLVIVLAIISVKAILGAFSPWSKMSKALCVALRLSANDVRLIFRLRKDDFDFVISDIYKILRDKDGNIDKAFEFMDAIQNL
ncbi:MAG: hypothetical protein PHX51_00870 [Clostridia bacterium]|nr:hypothetical protein [Clostridia bacterium]